jgi:branched-chain amino acid transport system permease protein
MTGASFAGQLVLNGLMQASIYILVGLGMALALSIVGIVQMAHGEIYMLGGYVLYYLAKSVGLPFFAALIITVIVVGALGIPIERIFYRRFRYGDEFSTVIMAVALMILLQTTAIVVFGSSTKVVTTPLKGVVKFGGAIISWERLLVVILAVLLVGALMIYLRKAKSGKAMIAVSQEMRGAALQGISVDGISAIAMVVGCALAALAGGLMGAIFTLSPSMGGPVLMKAIAVIILGGLGSITGVIVAGIILGFVGSVVTGLVSDQIASIVGFVLIMLVLLFRPQGIMGRPSQ